MEANRFFWHSKRGHGESIIELQNENIEEKFKVVKQIVLNNYAFLNQNESRSAYAYKLASFYNMNDYFIQLLLKKIKRTKLEDQYSFSYLVDTLYFFLKKEKNKYKNKIIKILKTRLNKTNYSINESASVASLISLILDLYKDKKHLEKIVNEYYFLEPESSLDLSMIKINYKLTLNKKNRPQFNLDYLNNIDDYQTILNIIQNEKSIEHMFPLISHYTTKKTMYALANNIIESEIKIKNRIVEIIYYSNLCDVKLMNKLLASFNENNDIFDSYVLEIACSLKSKKIKKFGYSLLDTKYKSYAIRIILNNYCNNDYDLIRKNIKKIKINFQNSDHWYEIEESLISYYKRKKIDMRLLNEVYYFMKNGLSSTSRFKLVKILLKYNFINSTDIQYLKLDANADIRDIIKKYK